MESFFPIYGIDMRLRKLQLGRVIIRNFTTYRKTLCRQVRREWEGTQNKQSVIDIIKDKEGIWAECQPISGQKSPEDNAVDDVLTAVDVITFFWSMISRDMVSVKIDDRVPGKPIRECFHLCADFPHFSGSLRLLEFTRPAILSVENLQKVRRFGFEKMREILSLENSTRSETHRRILDATRLYGKGYHEHEAHMKVVLWVIVLETLFSGTRHTEIGETIAIRCAIALGKGIEQREHLYRSVKEYYGIRSTVVHGNKVKDEIKYADLQRIVWYSIVWMIRNSEKLTTSERIEERFLRKNLA